MSRTAQTQPAAASPHSCRFPAGDSAWARPAAAPTSRPSTTPSWPPLPRTDAGHALGVRALPRGHGDGRAARGGATLRSPVRGSARGRRDLVRGGGFHGVADPGPRRALAAAHGGGVGARGAWRPGGCADGLGRRTAGGRSAARRATRPGRWDAAPRTVTGFTTSPRSCTSGASTGTRKASTPSRPPSIRVARRRGARKSSRGGSWRHHVRWSPPSARSSLPPTYRYADYGFRVLREEP